MLILQILVTLATVIALSAGVPQMVKLIKIKNSEEFNRMTWMMWVATQSVSTAYAIALGDVLLIVVNSAWVIFYLIMVILIIRYTPRSVLQPVRIDE